jgi:predicted 3-demethylubiquinone-9 3-methyltransferase (glyoxalase superfamily)
MKRIHPPHILLVVAVLLGAWAQSGAWGESDNKEQVAGGAMPAMPKIVPFLWYDDDAEEAIRFYASIFPDTKILSEARRGPKGPLMSATFLLGGREYMALNGGPTYSFTEAFSLFVSCRTQEEIDDLWAKLTADGGEPGRCGWLKDKFGLSWQVIPSALGEMLGDKDPTRARRVAEAMMKMNKLDIGLLRQAYEGR